MKKNIYLEFGNNYDLKTRLLIIKKIGFDGIFIWQDEDELRIEEVVNEARNQGLDIETMHLRFEGCNNLWLDNQEGEAYIQTIKRGVELAYMHKIPTVIMHTVAKLVHPKPSPIGLRRIREVLDLCEEYKIQLAIENVRDLEHSDYVFENLSSAYLKMCLDFGHTNCFAYKLEDVIFSKYKDYIVCLHIHDNFGTNDDHLIAFEGEIDIVSIVSSLKEIAYCGPLTNEAHIREGEDISDETFLIKVYDALLKIEELFKE